MQKCDPRAVARCPDSKTCGDHVFADGSDCEQFNQKVLAKNPTHGDRIRAKTDDDLADFIIDDCLDGRLHFCKNKPECLEILERDGNIPEEMCKQCALDWLQQPAEVKP
jgi:hypothetical protein